MSLHSTLVQLFGLLVGLTLTLVSSIKVEESNTGAIIKFPDVLTASLHNVTWEVQPADFGYSNYGGSLEAFLVLPANKSMHLECSQEPVDSNEFVKYIESYQGVDSLWFLVIDRGDCYYETKVYNAQQIGAAGAIVLDYEQEGFIIMETNDKLPYNVDIPSVMLKYDNAMLLMDHLGVKNWNAQDMSNCTYPNIMDLTGQSFVTTKAVIEWGLPHDNNQVSWEIWTSSNDDSSFEFKRNFKQTSEYLGANNFTRLTPHYYILNGSHWGCDTSSLRCGNQCTNSGRYCAVDPEKDLDLGISGADVVQEDLRQICVWKYAQEVNRNESVWWEYSILWDDNCFNKTSNALLFNTNCSIKQLNHLETNGYANLSNYVLNCIESSGGYGLTDATNSLLEYEVHLRESLSISSLPTFRVNEFKIYGEVDCNVVTEQECSVFDAICSGFLDGTAPDICQNTPAPTMAECADSLKDCSGVCYGNFEEDQCGHCLDPFDSSFDACVGCDGVPYSGFSYNPCGLCLNSSVSDFETRGDDCRGNGNCDDNWGIDKCGNCLWVASSDWDDCVGCDGVANSNASYHCGLCAVYGTHEWSVACDSGSQGSGSETNSNCTQKDCNGTCYGTKQTDLCGNCLDPQSTQWNSCVGCDDVVNSGFELNPCNECMDSTRDDFETFGQGCDGVCYSNFALDDCGVCRSTGDDKWNACYGCDDKKDSGKEINPCGYCISNTTINFDDYGKDCSGTCQGSKQTDQCGQCLEMSDSEWNSCVTPSPSISSDVTRSPSQYVVGTMDSSSGSTGSAGSKQGSGTSVYMWVAIVGGIVLVLVIVAAVGFCKLRKQQRTQTRRFESILRTYAPMNELNEEQENAGIAGVAGVDNPNVDIDRAGLIDKTDAPDV